MAALNDSDLHLCCHMWRFIYDDNRDNLSRDDDTEMGYRTGSLSAVPPVSIPAVSVSLLPVNDILVIFYSIPKKKKPRRRTCSSPLGGIIQSFKRNGIAHHRYVSLL
jgi:hypothetical protein